MSRLLQLCLLDQNAQLGVVALVDFFKSFNHELVDSSVSIEARQELKGSCGELTC